MERPLELERDAEMMEMRTAASERETGGGPRGAALRVQTVSIL
jgi:hypothetical protein